MKTGDLVKLAKWCHQPGETGLIIEVDKYGSSPWEDRQFKVLVNGVIRMYHPDDFYVLKWELS
jgi:hypothetical protein